MTTFIIWLPYYEYKHLLERQWSRLVCAIYNSVTRPIFVGSLGLILTGALVGKGRIVRFLLAGEFWSPWAKLSFMCYMVHIPVMLYFIAQIRISTVANQKDLIYNFLGYGLLAYLAAIPATLVIEAPYVLSFGGKKP